MRPALVSIISLCVLVLFLLSCSTTKRVIILVDGERRVVETQAATVDDVLRAQKIKLGDEDRVEPPGYTPIERTATIQIVRVQIKTETTHEPVEFARKLTRDETLPDGKMRVVQLGANGDAEVTFQITLEDGKEISRREIARTLVKPPRDEILTLGTQSSLAPVEFKGTVVYLAQGNAWVMRNSSNDKRPLTFEGDLDGRVFELSPDGAFLLFTRAGDKDLNSLWLVNTVVLDDKPRKIPLDELLYAQWAGDGSNQVAFSTGEKTAGAPGWKAHNDLSITILNGITETVQITTSVTTSEVVTATVPITPASKTFNTITHTVLITNSVPTSITISAKTPITLTTRQIISPSVPAPYSWWGGSLAWAPDTNAFAYTFADQVGIINAATGARRALSQFIYYNTRADWVWTPQIAWSPDSRFIAATVHALPAGAGPLEDSPLFELWVLARDNSVNLALGRDMGMWAFPAWSPQAVDGESKIAYGVALNAADSERSRYALDIMDRDGSNRQQIFPQGNEDGLQVIQVAWAPDGSQLIALREGDLWLYDPAKNVWSPLTANGDSKLPRWK